VDGRICVAPTDTVACENPAETEIGFVPRCNSGHFDVAVTGSCLVSKEVLRYAADKLRPVTVGAGRRIPERAGREEDRKLIQRIGRRILEITAGGWDLTPRCVPAMLGNRGTRACGIGALTGGDEADTAARQSGRGRLKRGERVVPRAAGSNLDGAVRVHGDRAQELFSGLVPDVGSASARSLAILEAVSRSEGPVSAIEIGPKVGLPRATVHRLMLVLERIGYLQREPGSRRWIIGDRLLRLSVEALRNSPKKGERHAVLQALVDEVQETCNVTVLVGNEVVYIDREECHWPLRTHFHIGSRIPIHCGASGKLFLSFMPASKRRRLLRAAPLKRYTERTVVDPNLIEDELKRVRASKVGIDVEEFIQGLIGVAVPVFNAGRRMCATVSMHAPLLRVTSTSAMEFVPALRRAADALVPTL
jgi:IclR family transcriptional regulator, acetate operon repressor